MIAEPDDSNGRSGAPAAGSRTETLSYIMDIIEELRRLAERAGYRTLAAVLGAALIEARVQSEEAER